MSTKYLARTAIEGGRGNRWERDFSHKEERSYTRAFLSKAANDTDYAEGRDPKHRKKVRKEFRDKLSAVHRWLDSNCGRPWADVKHDIHAMFDDRTTAGRHIMYDHMLREVRDWPEDVKTWYGARDYFMDAAGILRKNPPRRWSNYHRTEKRTRPQEVILAWAAGRLIRSVGSKLFWCVSDVRISDTHVCPDDWKRDKSVPSRYCAMCKERVTGFRQHKELTAAEVKGFNSLASFEQTLIMVSKAP